MAVSSPKADALHSHQLVADAVPPADKGPAAAVSAASPRASPRPVSARALPSPGKRHNLNLESLQQRVNKTMGDVSNLSSSLRSSREGGLASMMAATAGGEGAAAGAGGTKISDLRERMKLLSAGAKAGSAPPAAADNDT